MKTEYKHIYFEDESYLFPNRKTAVWCCFNKNGYYSIAAIAWSKQWKQYCFLPEDDMVFSISCMGDIIDFIKQLNETKDIE